MTYTLHYTSADGPGLTTTWSVYREQYVTANASEPIDGTSEHLSQHRTEAEADAEANRLQSEMPGIDVTLRFKTQDAALVRTLVAAWLADEPVGIEHGTDSTLVDLTYVKERHRD